MASDADPGWNALTSRFGPLLLFIDQTPDKLTLLSSDSPGVRPGLSEVWVPVSPVAEQYCVSGVFEEPLRRVSSLTRWPTPT